MHTARGRSESKHLRPTPAGHAEGCPVIALCRPGSPWQAGRGPVSCESGPGGLATQHRAGAARAQGRPLPSPGCSSLLGGPEEPGPPVSGAVWPGTWAARPPWPPALQLVVGEWGGWKWGEPPGHPALDGKSSRGRSEETSPEKVQRAREAAEGRAARRWCSTEDPASTPPDSQGSSAPCTTVGSPQFILSTGRLHPSPCVGGTWWPTRLSRP